MAEAQVDERFEEAIETELEAWPETLSPLRSAVAALKDAFARHRAELESGSMAGLSGIR